MLVPDLAGPGGERLKLLDFGIAKLGSGHSQGDEVKTRTGQIMGTAGYMSPEQFTSDKPIDGQSDVYSMGCVMFRLLSGRLPFMSDSGEMALAAMHMFKPPPPLKDMATNASPWLIELVESMLAKTPGERPTMSQVATQLQEHLPFRAPSRSSMPPVTIDSSGVVRLSSFEATLGQTGYEVEALAPTQGQAAPLGPISGRSGTITRASGQASMVMSGWARKRSLFLAAGLALLLAAGGGLLFLRNLHVDAATQNVTTPPPPAQLEGALPDAKVPKAATAATAPAAPTRGVVEPAANHSDKQAGADLSALQADLNNATGKTGKTGKTGNKQNGKSRNKSHSITIIN